MLLRKAALIITVLLVLTTVGLAVWFWKTQNRLYSDPVMVRTNDAYLRIHSPATNAPPAPTNLYSHIHIDRDTNRIQISFPTPGWRSAENDYAPLQIHRADSNHVIRLGDGSVRLAYIGAAFAPPGINFDPGAQVPAKYYTPDGTPLEDPPKILEPHQRTISFSGDFPTWQFVFVSSNIAKFKTLRFTAFDARTQYQLTTGYSSGRMSENFEFHSTLHLWHQTPVELVATIAVGPIQSYSLPASEGAEVEFPGGEAQVILASEHDLGGWSSRHDGKSNVISFNLNRRMPTKRPRKTTSYVFHVWPKAYSAPFEFEFLGADGKALQSLGTSTSGHLVICRVEADLEAVKEIRLNHYPNIHRLIYTVPELPGLPEQNRNIENLFDVHIPYTYFRYEYDFQYAVSRSLQMDQSHFSLTFPNGYFPTFRTNTNPRTLFQEMELLLANPELQLVADPQKNELRTRMHPIRAALEAVKKKLGI